MHGTIFVQIRLYESLFIATTDYVQVDFSNIDCMEVVIVKWLLWYAQVYGTIFVQTKLYGSLFIATTNCVQVYFSNIVYGKFYCGMVVMVCTGH